MASLIWNPHYLSVIFYCTPTQFLPPKIVCVLLSHETNIWSPGGHAFFSYAHMRCGLCRFNKCISEWNRIETTQAYAHLKSLVKFATQPYQWFLKHHFYKLCITRSKRKMAFTFNEVCLIFWQILFKINFLAPFLCNMQWVLTGHQISLADGRYLPP